MTKYLICILIVACACTKSPVERETDSSPELTEVQAPSLVNPADTYLFQATVTDPQGLANVHHVLVSFFRDSANDPFAYDSLWDDGASLHPEDGDIVAKDGIFSQRIKWLFSEEGSAFFTLRFQAFDNDSNASNTIERDVIAQKNDAPRILSVAMPDTVYSGFSGERFFKVEVSDSQGIENIAQVSFEGFQGGSRMFWGECYNDGSRGDDVAGDSYFTLGFDSAYAAAKRGAYLLQFRAADLLDQQSELFEKEIFFENEPPLLGEVVIPDSVAKPSTGVTLVLMTIVVNDPQSLVDIEFVGFTSRTPDSTYANNGNPIPMVDNGLAFYPGQMQAYGDRVAADGIFSFTLPVYADAEAAQWDAQGRPVQEGWYEFTFHAEDKVGNGSDEIVKQFKIY